MAGKLGTIEVFINFPIMDINRNLKRQRVDQVTPENLRRMDAFWGDRSWHEVMYQPSSQTEMDLGLGGSGKEKQTNEVLAEAYRLRLQRNACFAHVPTPIPMRNSKGNTVYYLYFATPKPTANKIVSEIFAKYRDYIPR